MDCSLSGEYILSKGVSSIMKFITYPLTEFLNQCGEMIYANC